MSNKKFSILTVAAALLVFYLISARPSASISPSIRKGKLEQNASATPPSPSRAEGDTKQFQPLSPSSSSLSFVSRVIDGDTIELDTGEKVRYIGMNTPETVDPRRPVQCFGHEASAYNKSLVENKKVKLIKDVTAVDKYGRLLRYVYLEDGTFVNLKLVADGYASIYTFPPNVAHRQDFAKAQREAKAAGLGLWNKCNSMK